MPDTTDNGRNDRRRSEVETSRGGHGAHCRCVGCTGEAFDRRGPR